VWLVCVVLIVIAVALWVWFLATPQVGDQLAMPVACPACRNQTERTMFGNWRDWYYLEGDRRYECRQCHTRFREHPDGSFVRDRDA